MVRNQGHSKCTWTIISTTTQFHKLMRNCLKLQISYENRFAIFCCCLLVLHLRRFSFFIEEFFGGMCVCVPCAYSLVASSVILCHCAFFVSFRVGAASPFIASHTASAVCQTKTDYFVFLSSLLLLLWLIFSFSNCITHMNACTY